MPEKGKAPASAGACPVSSSEPIQKKTTATILVPVAKSLVNAANTVESPDVLRVRRSRDESTTISD
jgi:hypothetical protein